MKKKLRMICLLLLCGLLSACIPDRNAMKKAASFEGGTSYRTSHDVYWVLNLRGTWRAMGRQYGGLVKEDLTAFCREITADLTARGMDVEAQTAAARELAESLSAELNELLAGMAETSGLTLDEVRRVNAAFFNLSGLLLEEDKRKEACSTIAAWNTYTPDGKLVIGRNWDMQRDGMQAYMQYLSVVVFHPTDGFAFANVHPLGAVFLETGLNEKGLFTEMNGGLYSDNRYYPDREDSASVLVSVLHRCATIEEAAAKLASVPADAAYSIQLADNKRAVAVERPTFDCRVREGDEKGLLVAYNSFVPPYPPSWDEQVAPPRETADDGRYTHLTNLANAARYYGNLDMDTMRSLLSVTYPDGGAVHAGTVYQVVAAPADFALWMRGYGYSGWQRVDLKGLLGVQE